MNPRYDQEGSGYAVEGVGIALRQDDLNPVSI